MARRRIFTPEFKARVVLDELTGVKTSPRFAGSTGCGYSFSPAALRYRTASQTHSAKKASQSPKNSERGITHTRFASSWRDLVRAS
jgi:hypothetical protein